MDEIQKTLLMQVADLHDVPAGAYNIRANGESAGRRSTEHIEIVTKEEILPQLLDGSFECRHNAGGCIHG